MLNQPCHFSHIFISHVISVLSGKTLTTPGGYSPELHELHFQSPGKCPSPANQAEDGCEMSNGGVVEGGTNRVCDRLERSETDTELRVIPCLFSEEGLGNWKDGATLCEL